MINGQEFLSAISSLVERSTPYAMLLHLRGRHGHDDKKGDGRHDKSDVGALHLLRQP